MNLIQKYLRFWLAPMPENTVLPFVPGELEAVTQADIERDENGNIPAYVSALWFPIRHFSYQLRLAIATNGVLVDLMDGSDAIGRLLLPDAVIQKTLLLWRNVRMQQNERGSQTPINTSE
jgi:hypothetical protein